MLVDRQRLAQREAVPVEADGFGRVGEDHMAGSIGQSNLQGSWVDMYRDGIRLEAIRGGADGNVLAPNSRGHGPTCVLAEAGAARDSDRTIESVSAVTRSRTLPALASTPLGRCRTRFARPCKSSLQQGRMQ